MRFIRHLLGLIGEFFGFAWHFKAWWIIPLILILLLMALFVLAGHATAPFIYTLF